MNLITTEFNGIALNILDHEGRKWLTADQVGQCLGYAEATARTGITNLYNRHKEEFTETDTCAIKLMAQGQRREVRIFSDTGCQLLGFFANTEKAKEFRAWAKKVLAMASVIQTSPDRGEQILDTLVRLLERSEAREERLMSLMERLLPAPGNTRRKGKTMYAADMARIKAMRAAGATLEDMVAATGFSQTQVSYVIGDQVRVKPDGRVVTVHRYAQALAAEKSREEARKQQGGNDLFGELPEAEASSRPTQLKGQSARATPYQLPPNPHRCAGAERACPASAPDLSSESPAPDSAHTPAPETSPQKRKIQPMAGFPANPYRT